MKTYSLPALVVTALVAFGLGAGLGFGAGIGVSGAGAALLDGLVESEAPADVDHPVALERRGFALSYPGNWTIDTADEDYDPDEAFSIDSPGSAFASLRFYGLEMDPEDHVTAQQGAFARLMPEAKVERFTRLGELDGRGMILRGRMLTIPATVKIFAHARPDATLLVVMQTPDDDAPMTEPGFALIARTLKLTAPPTPAQDEELTR